MSTEFLRNIAKEHLETAPENPNIQQAAILIKAAADVIDQEIAAKRFPKPKKRKTA